MPVKSGRYSRKRSRLALPLFIWRKERMKLSQAPGAIRFRRDRWPQLLVLVVVGLGSAMLLTACGGKHSGGHTAVLETDLGDIKFELLEDEAPQTVENFRLLAERGYYNG